MRMIKIVLAGCMAGAIIGSVGCNGAGSSPTAPTTTSAPTSSVPNVIGSWSGTMRTTAGVTRQVRMTLTGAANNNSYLFGGNWSFPSTGEGADVYGLVQSNPFSMRLNAQTSSLSLIRFRGHLNRTGNFGGWIH